MFFFFQHTLLREYLRLEPSGAGRTRQTVQERVPLITKRTIPSSLVLVEDHCPIGISSLVYTYAENGREAVHTDATTGTNDNDHTIAGMNIQCWLADRHKR